MLLVEQNATMALSIAHVRLRAGERQGRQGRPRRRAARGPGHPGVLPGRRRGGPPVVPRREDLPAQEDVVGVEPWQPSRSSSVDGITLRFGGVTALDDVSFDVLPGRAVRRHRPERRRQDVDLQLPQRRVPAAGGLDHARRATSSSAGRRPPIAALGVARTFQNLGLFANLTVIDNLMLGRHHLMRTGFVAGALWFGRARREEIEHRERCEEIIELLELEPYRQAAGRRAALRHPEAHRAGPGPGHGPAAAAARRAGGRHEPRGDRGHGPLHPRDPRRSSTWR